jgi:(1->4)-alpha-D-glucan 1-alpha-D-glucosylmutase
LADVDRFVGEVRLAGWQNTLSQLLLKVASPGFPDFYQGTELWEDSLVDPDNRRPVDFARRREMLARLVEASDDRAALVAELIEDIESGALKLFVTWGALELRRRLSAVFEGGSYVPLEVQGARAGHVVAFARVLGETSVVALAGRHYAGLGARHALPGSEAWGDTRVALPASMPQGPYRSAFLGCDVEAGRHGGGRCLVARDVLVPLPVALLYTE